MEALISVKEISYNYFLVCKSCTDEECCADPCFIFCASNEIQKIEQKIKEFSKEFQEFLSVDTIRYKNKTHLWYGLKKINGKCIFLKGRTCLIHEVKPLQCRAYPLIWGWEEEGNKLIIYADENSGCLLAPILLKDKNWVETMKKVIFEEVQEMSIADRFAFQSLESTGSPRMIDILNLQK